MARDPRVKDQVDSRKQVHPKETFLSIIVGLELETK